MNPSVWEGVENCLSIGVFGEGMAIHPPINLAGDGNSLINEFNYRFRMGKP